MFCAGTTVPYNHLHDDIKVDTAFHPAMREVAARRITALADSHFLPLSRSENKQIQDFIDHAIKTSVDAAAWLIVIISEHDEPMFAIRNLAQTECPKDKRKVFKIVLHKPLVDKNIEQMELIQFLFNIVFVIVVFPTLIRLITVLNAYTCRQ